MVVFGDIEGDHEDARGGGDDGEPFPVGGELDKSSAFCAEVDFLEFFILVVFLEGTFEDEDGRKGYFANAKSFGGGARFGGTEVEELDLGDCGDSEDMAAVVGEG